MTKRTLIILLAIISILIFIFACTKPDDTTYTVTYNGNGNDGGQVPVDENEYLEGEVVSIFGNPGNLEKTGYNFVGWNTQPNGGGDSYSRGNTLIMGTSNVTLYAMWKADITYSVTYNGNGNDDGEVPSDSNEYLEGDTVTVLGNISNLEKTGYSFAGWNTKDDASGDAYNEGDTFIMGNMDVTLYAMWSAEPTYKVFYNDNLSEGGEVPIDQNEYLEGDTVTVLGNVGNLYKPGYEFGGWSNDKHEGYGDTYQRGDTFIMGSENVNLYAIWSTNPTYSVIYDGNGNDSGDVPVDDNIYYQGDNVTVLNNSGNLAKSGHTFIGWNTQEDGNGDSYGEYETFTMGDEDITLYAKWSALPVYTVAFDSQGGSSVGTQYIIEGGLVSEPSNPTKEGYSFDGWFNSSDPWDFANDTVNSDMTLTAQWTINSYTVTFDSQGGNAVDPQTVNYGGLVSEPSNPTKEGYSFDGWFNGSDPWDFANDTVSSDMTLTAQWTINSYTVTFDSQGGSAVDPQTVNHGGLVSEPSEPTKEGYTFVGWFNGIESWDFANDTVTSDVTLSAQWSINSYTVTFDSQGGSAIDPQTVNYGGLVSEPSYPTKTGFIFGGWYKEIEITNAWDFDNDTVTSDVTLFAKWDVAMEANDDLLANSEWDFYEDRDVSFSVTDLTGNDNNFINPGGQIEVISVDNAVNGTITLNGTTLTFRADVGTVGSSASFTYVARVTHESVNYEDTATVTIEEIVSPPAVVAVNDGPYSMNQSAEMVLATTDLLANDEGEDGTNNNLQFLQIVAGSEVNLSVTNNSGNLTITSTGPAYTAAQFQYEIEDTTHGQTAIGTVFFDIGPLPPIESYVFVDTNDFDDFKANNVPATFEDIFNNWGRFDGGLVFANKAEADAAGSSSASWELIDAGTDDERVRMPLNVDPYNGFFSDEELENYTFEATLYSNDNDNDSISLIIAYAEDGGEPYALSAVRTGTGATPEIGWGVIEGKTENSIDYNDNSSTIIESISLPGQRDGWDGYYSRVKVERTGDTVKTWTTDFASTRSGALSLPYLPESLIEIDLSSDPRFTKYQGAKPYGYGTFSQPNSTYFDVVFTGGLDTETVILLTNGVDTDSDSIIDRWTGSEVWKYDGSQWVLQSGLSVQDELGYPREVTFPDGQSYFITENYIDLVID
jgi:uncharacterized repeat protein (TIGR02543 family)